MHIGYWQERDLLKKLGIDGWIILRWISEDWYGGILIGLLWLRIGIGGKIL
jgi:hypothetical protein